MTIDFDALYRTHYRRVFGLCLRLLGGRAQAEDAAQEVFVRAYRSLDRYDSEQPFAAWVQSIASNHCIDLIRRRNRKTGFLDRSETEPADPDDAATPAEALSAAERGAEVRATINALPDKYRVPVVMAYFSDRSYDEIAAELGITRNHVGVLLLRAKRRLRAALASDSGASR